MPKASPQIIYQSKYSHVKSYCDFNDNPLETEKRIAPYSSIAIPRRGVFTKSNRRRTHTVTVNDAILFHENEEYVMGHPDAKGDETTEFVLSQSVLKELNMDIANTQNPQIDSMHIRPLALIDPTSAIMHHLIIKASLDTQNRDDLLIEECIFTLLNRLVRQFNQIPNDDHHTQRLTRAYEDLIGEAKWILSRNHEQHITIDSLSDSLNISPFHLCRIFRHLTGETIHSFLTRVRLNISLSLLLQSSDPITTIAFRVGFSSHSHYSTWFRRVFGITPSKLRKLAENDLAELHQLFSTIDMH